ncbi:hypothetical protein K402DRAFT_331836 [Aulographum hederae CBS 113979]|uniref:Cyclic-AMP phosphodiesterase n=1 Tax=Aulographum hederae CBS 113979 TaxID=1176131 RepID=A0A6G1H119_9PEZI|nr:hypothetical protein K402DRAFT_331836 [Aulographum hederae CBS 113979]
MKERNGGAAGAARRGSRPSGIQVICLGSSGGPSEDNVTGFLVRSVASNWSKGSLLAVDAGSHLAAVTRILQSDFPLVAPDIKATNGNENEDGPSSSAADSDTPSSRSASPVPPATNLDHGPFAGLPFPHASARANAAYLVREHVATYLITHPHLDHLSGFAINTAAFHNTSRPKRLAALPFTVNAIKTHIFNDIIWPNLTDEDGGVGFVTFQRLHEGGNNMLGEGPGAGFIEVCDGLAVKAYRVTHGHCMKCPIGHQLLPAPGQREKGNSVPNINNEPLATPQHHHNLNHSQSVPHSMTLSSSQSQQQQDRRGSLYSHPSAPGTPTVHPSEQQCVVDSTAYFIRTTDQDSSGTSQVSSEILIFGDVEPDSLSFSPRTATVWAEAAPKIASGFLKAIFIECSYDDRQRDEILFGHLAPRHLIQELGVLAEMVVERKKELATVDREREQARSNSGRKRKRTSLSLGSYGFPPPPPQPSTPTGESKSKRSQSRRPASPSSKDEVMGDSEAPLPVMPAPLPGETSTAVNTMREGPLKGIKVVVIHVKDTLSDGPLVEESILAQLQAHDANLSSEGQGLGCEFAVSRSGDSYLF